MHDFPGSQKCNFGQEVSFTHDGRDFLEYHSHTWVLDKDGNKVRPLESESGFWRIDADRKVEVTMTRDDGVIEIWYGEMADKKPQIDLVTDAVARTRLSRVQRWQAAVRLCEERPDVGGREADPEVPLRPYMSAQLKKVVTPEDVERWAKALPDDLPDNGIAFFK
ncbi:FABP family protein [Streptomyces nogalater]